MPPSNSTASRYSVHPVVLKANASASLLYSAERVERLSGKSLCGSNGVFFGSAKGPKRCPFAPFCGIKRPRNGARSDFPDSLGKGILRSSGFV